MYRHRQVREQETFYRRRDKNRNYENRKAYNHEGYSDRSDDDYEHPYGRRFFFRYSHEADDKF